MHILLVEDDKKVADSLKQGLEEMNYRAQIARTGDEAARLIENTKFDLVILDLGLPGKDGMEVLAEIRSKKSRVPVIILTARDTVDDRVKGLDKGADDYMVKPFAFSELIARIHALLRRAHGGDNFRLKVEDLEVDVVGRRVVRAGREIELTEREFLLLEYLVRNAGTTVSRDMLAREVWRETSRVTPLDNVIDVHISHLRDKVDEGFSCKLIHTVRGMGFMVKGAA
jgi:two-component system copper resistance phosphate regulon response regulator CusR